MSNIQLGPKKVQVDRMRQGVQRKITHQLRRRRHNWAIGLLVVFILLIITVTVLSGW